MPANQSTPEVTRADEAKAVLNRILVMANRLRRSELTPAEFDADGVALLLGLCATPAAEEPFGYWVEQKHAEPVLLRKPTYIPEPSQLRTVTPLSATPARGGDELREAEQWLRAISDWLLTHDHDMTLPDGILDTDPLDIADRLASLTDSGTAATIGGER